MRSGAARVGGGDVDSNMHLKPPGRLLSFTDPVSRNSAAAFCVFTTRRGAIAALTQPGGKTDQSEAALPTTNKHVPPNCNTDVTID